MIFRDNMNRKRYSERREILSQTAATFLGIAIFVMILIFSGCGNDDSVQFQRQEVIDVIILPDSTEFRVGEQVQFSAFVLTEDEDTIATEDLDVEWEGEWWSSDSDVFTVENDGLATGKNAGEAFCIIELDLEDEQILAKAGLFVFNSARVPIGLDSAYVKMLN